MLVAQLLFALILLVVCSFAPGFFIVRRFRWSPLEKLCGGVGLSLTLVYVATWLIYLLGPDAQSGAYYAVSAVSAVLALLAWRDIKSLVGIPRIRRVLAGFGFLLAWSLSMLAMIRVYDGAGWAGDWGEHLQRSLFFLHRFPVQTKIYPFYEMPARPPLMNVLAGFFMGQAGDRFEVYQFVFVFLNLLLFLACCLLLPALAGRRRTGKRGLLALVGIFAMSPLVMESVTYTWTKALAAFFVIAALSFYLAALRKGDSRRMVAAFLALAAGLLVHYSAGPYVVILTIHYLVTSFRQRGVRVKELAVIACVCAALLFSWFGWSLAVYGTHATLASNTAVTDSQKYSGSTWVKIAGNIYDTVVPPIVRDPDSLSTFDQPNSAGTLRDNAFILYQTNLVFSMGALGGPLAVWLLLAWLCRKDGASPQRSFWLVLIPSAVVLGIAVIGERDTNGLAHLTLLPIEIIGLTWLAANFCRHRWVAWLILAGSLVDVPLGVLLHARIENLENRPGHIVFGGLRSTRNGVSIMVSKDPQTINPRAWPNWFHKHRHAMSRQWLADLDRSGDRDTAPLRKVLVDTIAEDQTLWHGWYSRHDGTATYFGDHFGEGWLPFSAMLAAWLALLWTLARNLPPAAAVPKASAAKVRRRPRARNR